MTSVPPEPPAGSEPSATPPTPPTPPTPAAQQWSAPPATQPGPSAHPGGFNIAAIKPFDWGILAAGFLAFIFSFISYYTYSSGPFEKDYSAWDSFFGWASTLLALFAAGLLAVQLFAPQVRLPIPVRMVVLGGFAVALLLVIIAGFVDSRDYASRYSIDAGRGAGYFLSLIVILAGGVLSYLRLRETGGKLPWEKGA